MYICICLNLARTTVHSFARYTILKVSDSSKHRRGRVGVGLEGFTSLQAVRVHLILMYSKMPGIAIQLWCCYTPLTTL